MDDAVSIGSTGSVVGPKCRICGDHKELMISPCDCKGSIAHVHVACLDQWISVQKHSECPVCLASYAHRFRLKPIEQWYLPPVTDRITSWKLCFSGIWMFFIVPLILTFFISETITAFKMNHSNDWTIDKRNNRKSEKIYICLMCAIVGLATLCSVNNLYRYFKQWQMVNRQEEWTNKTKKRATTSVV